jgi:hypothetical protein
MATSLYDLSVGSYLQIVTSTAGVLEKGAAHCNDNGISLDDVVATRLYPDMADFRFQVYCVAHHSLGAIKGIQTGEFTPPGGYESLDYAALQGLINDTLAELDGIEADSINALEGGNVIFKIGDNEIPFTNENFILSFSLPNFYFHAATAYDILRMQGVPIGKRNFLGNMKMGI